MSPQLITTTRAYLRRYKLLRTLIHALRTLSRAPRTRLAAYQQRRHDLHRQHAELLRQRSAATQFHYQPVLSLLTVAHNSDLSGLRATIASLRSQTYPGWELCVACDSSLPPAVVAALNKHAAKDARILVTHGTAGSGESAALANAALGRASGEFVGLLAVGDQLAPEALYAVAALLNQQPAADLIYTDEDEVGADGVHCRRVLKPDWSPEHFLSGMYTGGLSLYGRARVNEVGGFREELEGAHEYDLALRIVERSKHIHHVGRVLYHRRGGRSGAGAAAQLRGKGAAQRAVQEYLERNRVAAICEAGENGAQHRVRYRITGQPLVSIIIPTAGYRRVVGEREVDLLVNCVQSVLGKTQYQNYEILCISDGDLRQDTKQAIADARVRIITFSKPFNFAEKINFGARHARGEQLLFLNDDTEVIAGEWLTAMLEYAQQQAVGAVGAKLYFPDGAIQHAGVVIRGDGPCHIFYGYPKEEQEGLYALNVVCNYSAVTGACLMTRREVFAEVTGFNEAFPVNYNDVDYCLKVRERGYRVVYTPYAELFHLESPSRSASKIQGSKPEETKLFKDTWGDKVMRDPYYSSLLNLHYFSPRFASASIQEGRV